MLEYSKEQTASKKMKIDMTIYNMQAAISKTLSNPIRLAILHSLRENERNVREMIEIVGISQSNLSQHLAVMRQTGLLKTKKQGTSVFYRVANAKINQACDMVREVLLDQLSNNYKLAQNYR